MANRVIGDIAKQEIRNAMRCLSGSAAKTEAVRLAELHKVNWQHIYKMTADLRKGLRKPRADKGKRTFELVEGTDVWQAAQLVVADKLDPDQARQTIQLRNPEAQLPSLEYFRQMLAEKGLGRKQRRNPKRAYRSWEAENPCDLFQIDVTALKVRWQDEKTRRILRIEGVDKNHPQMDPTKLRVWQILLKDDMSRRVFLRYVVTRAMTSTEMVRFEVEAFDELGVPITVYTDQGGEFKSRYAQAEKILNSLPSIRDTGGFQHIAHAPHNAQATGKVENGHQWAEKMDRFVGLAVTEGQIVTIEMLNEFATRVCEDYNNRIHRVTKQTPMERWHSKRIVIRKLPTEVIESALLSDSFDAVLDASMTIARDGKAYKVPGVQPFVNFIGQKVKVVVPPNIDIILLSLPDGSEYEIEKILATADKAGEFRSVADSTPENLRKRLRETRKEEVKTIKEKQKLTGQIAPVPHFNVKIETPASNVAQFPQPEHIVSVEEVGNVVQLPGEIYTGKPIGYWQAVVDYTNRFGGGVDEAKEFLLGIFPNQQGEVPAAEVEAFIDHRSAHQRQRLLRAV